MTHRIVQGLFLTGIFVFVLAVTYCGAARGEPGAATAKAAVARLQPRLRAAHKRARHVRHTAVKRAAKRIPAAPTKPIAEGWAAVAGQPLPPVLEWRAIIGARAWEPLDWPKLPTAPFVPFPERRDYRMVAGAGILGFVMIAACCGILWYGHRSQAGVVFKGPPRRTAGRVATIIDIGSRRRKIA